MPGKIHNVRAVVLCERVPFAYLRTRSWSTPHKRRAARSPLHAPEVLKEEHPWRQFCRACHRSQNYCKKTLCKINVLLQLIYKNCPKSLHKADSWAGFLAKRDTPVAATLQRKSFGRTILLIIAKIITKKTVWRNYFVIISARMVTS